MKYRELSQREKFILYLGAGLLGLSLIFNFIVSPLIAKVSSLNTNIASKTTLLKRYARLASRGEGIISSYDTYKDSLADKRTTEEVTADLFTEIEKTAQKFNVHIEKIKPSASLQKRQVKRVSLEVELTADLDAIFKFINHLEISPSLIRVLSLRLIPQANNPSQLRCRIGLARLFF